MNTWIELRRAETRVLLVPGSGVNSRRLTAAAAQVFHDYRAEIDRQHALMQQHVVYFETRLPRPQVTVDVAADGVRCVVRYPVPPEDTVTIDQQMLEALRAAVDSDEELQLLETGAVRLSLEG